MHATCRAAQVFAVKFLARIALRELDGYPLRQCTRFRPLGQHEPRAVPVAWSAIDVVLPQQAREWLVLEENPLVGAVRDRTAEGGPICRTSRSNLRPQSVELEPLRPETLH